MSQRIMIMGASHPLSDAIKVAFMTQGAHVHCVDIAPHDKQNQLHLSEINALAGFHLIRAAFANADAVLGGIDTLVNVGVQQPIPPMPVTRAEQLHTQLVAVTGTVGMSCTEGIPFLQRQTGTKRIINVWLYPDTKPDGSIDHTRDDASDLIHTHTRYLAHSCAPHGIVVTTLIYHGVTENDAHTDFHQIPAWVLFLTTRQGMTVRGNVIHLDSVPSP